VTSRFKGAAFALGGDTVHADGPRFSIRTWQADRPGLGVLWFARVVRIRPECAPGTDPQDEGKAVVEGRPRLPDAVRAAVARFLAVHG